MLRLLKSLILFLALIKIVKSHLTYVWVKKAREEQKFPKIPYSSPYPRESPLPGYPYHFLKNNNYQSQDDNPETSTPQRYNKLSSLSLGNGVHMSGVAGLSGDTYIENNYQDYNGNFVSMKIFKGQQPNWNLDKEEHWRSNAKSSYFQNKIPGSELILPASVVEGAATAFGLVTLLPLNVPAGKPLMYCKKETYGLSQDQINLNGKVYECINSNERIIVSDLTCARNNLNNISDEDCSYEVLSCEWCDQSLYQCPNILCKNGMLISKKEIYCTSSIKFKTATMINCYEGYLAASQASRIPVIEMSEATTEKSLSFAAHVHVFLLKLIGKSEVLEKPVETTTISSKLLSYQPSAPIWVPKALKIIS